MTAGGKVDVAGGVGEADLVSSVMPWCGTRAQGGVASWAAGVGLACGCLYSCSGWKPGHCRVAAKGGGAGASLIPLLWAGGRCGGEVWGKEAEAPGLPGWHYLGCHLTHLQLLAAHPAPRSSPITFAAVTPGHSLHPSMSSPPAFASDVPQP